MSHLVITRGTVEEVLANAATEIAPVSPAAEKLEGTALPRPSRSPVIGVVAVPPRRAGLEVSVLPQDYRDLLEVAEGCRASAASAPSSGDAIYARLMADATITYADGRTLTRAGRISQD